MNIWILGNGFDIYHNLPTNYINFLNTVDFLRNNYNTTIDTVGKVFGNEILLNRDRQIKKSYDKYGSVYNSILLDPERINFLINKAESNQWFIYLLKILNNDIGWIDFEKEVSRVLDLFGELITLNKETNGRILFPPKKPHVQFICETFDFFIKKRSENGGIPYKMFDKAYIKEEPLGSKHYIINKALIADTLYKSLAELAKMLQMYLNIFVDSTIDLLKANNLIKIDPIFEKTDLIVTFNYTNTFEKLYFGKECTDVVLTYEEWCEQTAQNEGQIQPKLCNPTIFHIHGTINERIVLGINPNDFDEINAIDTSFIAFKKYYQRGIYRTDMQYFQYISKYDENDNVVGNSLHVFGHSLDVTDRDIIDTLFKMANDISIYCHSEEALGQYIKNLVSLYGKHGFDELRTRKNLRFIPIKIDEEFVSS